ncbi:MAG: hypothetical protein OET79_13875, partial [Nitrospirota bacterium]|nr:hypothetical protein [Nitrospirota bacterium]
KTSVPEMGPIDDTSRGHVDQIEQAIAGHVTEVGVELIAGAQRRDATAVSPRMRDDTWRAEPLRALGRKPDQPIPLVDQQAEMAAAVEIDRLWLTRDEIGTRRTRERDVWQPASSMTIAGVATGFATLVVDQVEIAIPIEILEVVTHGETFRGFVNERGGAEAPATEALFEEPRTALLQQQSRQAFAMQIDPAHVAHRQTRR